jgi:hypothetical protein
MANGHPIPQNPRHVRSPKAVARADLPAHFWWRWSAGTFAIPLASFLACQTALPGVLAGLLAVGGITIGLANIWLALATRGYSSGRHVALGRTIAVVTGWIGTALVGLALAVVALAAIIAVAILRGLAHAGDA